MSPAARPPFPVEPWTITEPSFDAAALDEHESVFTLANGRIGVRGSIDEGDPCGLPATYLAGLFEERDLHYPEEAYGQPRTSQTVISAPDATVLRLFVDGTPLTTRSDGLRGHRRMLDLRAGTLHRVAEWAVRGGAVRIDSTRLVSFELPGILAVRSVVTALDTEVRVHLHAEVRANAEAPQDGSDPRAATVLTRPLRPELHETSGETGVLVHRTYRSLRRVAVAARLDAPAGVAVDLDAAPDRLRAATGAVLAPGRSLTLTRYVAYACSGRRSVPQVRDDVLAAVAAARALGWDGLVAAQRAYLDAFWDDADVEVDGDPPVQQAVRFGLFHVLQAGARTGAGPIAAKGLTGNGYDGHTMWDTESFVLPVLTYLRPDAAADALRWRHATLGLARDRARQLRLAGAAFPWRSIDGRECSGYWPAGTAAMHVGADIADAVLRHQAATGDEGFARDVGLELLVETARLWYRTGRFDDQGRFHLDGVTGPDEYSALGSDNVYTNLMAARNLLGAAEAAARYPREAGALGVTAQETAGWRAAAEAVHLPYDAKRGVHQQHTGFTELAEWDFAATGAEDYPLLLHHPYLELYRRQVVKQADLVLAMQRCGDAFTHEQKARNFAYYEQRTVRDSSLSAAPQAVIAAEVGHLDLAHAYLAESALQDLNDTAGKTRNGLHVASLAGAWTVLVMGFGGLRDERGGLAFAPRLPDRLRRLRFTLRWRGARVRVEIDRSSATYTLRDGPDAAVELHHHGAPVTVRAGTPVTLPIPPLAPPAQPAVQPPGRAPRH